MRNQRRSLSVSADSTQYGLTRQRNTRWYGFLAWPRAPLAVACAFGIHQPNVEPGQHCLV